MSETTTTPRRLLIIDELAKDKAALVMKYARGHIFHPREDPNPGDNPNYCCMLNDYLCVFTYSKSLVTGALYRHLSISVPSDLYPSPESAAAIAEIFGFTGADQGMERRVASGDWTMYVEKGEPHYIVLLEELKDG